MTPSDSDERTKEGTYPLSHRTRFRYSRDRIGNDITRFRIQLEYRINGQWLQVVGSDHNPMGEYGHDVTKEGVHIDVYRDGDRIAQEPLMGSTDPTTAYNEAESHITEHHDGFVRRFEQWHKDRIQRYWI